MDSACSFSGGYDNHFLSDTEKYHCPVCLLVLRDAMQTSCGHRFCQTCITRVIGKSTMLKCPVDKQFSKLNQIFPDVAIRREVLCLSVRCSHDECSWTGDIRDYQNHMETCAMEEVSCPFGCDVTTRRCDVGTHVKNCQLRDIKCDYCKENIQYHVFESHLLECLKAPVSCALCKEEGFLREDLENHMDPGVGSCPEVLIQCPYHRIGCVFTSKRTSMSDHLNSPSSIANHLETVSQTITKHETTQKDLKSSITKLTARMEAMEFNLQRYDRKSDGWKKQLRERNVTGCLHWKINLRGRGEFCSSPFYSGCPGYKIMVDIDTQRDGNVRFGLILLRGDYDDQVMWPFNATCYISVLDQNVGGSKPNNYSTNLVIREVPRNRYGNRGDRLFKRSLPQALTRDEIIGQGSRFVRNGCIFLEVSVVHCVYPMPETNSPPMTNITPMNLRALQNPSAQSTPSSPVFSLASAVSLLQ